jgi:hypothetical protein
MWDDILDWLGFGDDDDDDYGEDAPSMEDLDGMGWDEWEAGSREH